jgi:hypothetical protein
MLMGNRMPADLCPTCKQPIPREATTPDPRGGAKLPCEFCGKRAAFIIRRHAVCFECREKAAFARFSGAVTDAAKDLI